ncbi:uncharacterized protein L201_001367 [Kwoniella dendrophila CBS 6074]|uniref:NADH dehydrogenase (Ubiquinone) 1 alpha subcomplex 5 n=1 Tax=Kwoniella dendrophila CBS 6074 TaxID=1295534 RepID=A0AAX4JPL2_9TREE
MLRASRVLFNAIKPAVKVSTGLTGIEVNSKALPELKSIYKSTLTTLNHLPSTSIYKQATESLINHRLNIIESNQDNLDKVESEFGKIIELTLDEAKSEQALVAKMLEWKSWEQLETEPHPDQWRYFEPASDV